MADKNRNTVAFTLFQLRRMKQIRFNIDVPMAVERFSGRRYTYTWMTMKTAMFQRSRNRGKLQNRRGMGRRPPHADQ